MHLMVYMELGVSSCTDLQPWCSAYSWGNSWV